jgi:tetratricopeptide (TPR) repeat protein
MRSAKQYIADRFPWLNLFDSIAAAFVLALIAVPIWPHARLMVDLVFITAIPGLIAAIVWSLTFWPKARVQIGRLKLRYKAVRRSAGIAALACLPFLLLQQASIYLQGPNILRELPPEVAEATAPYPKLGERKVRVVVAIAHLEGDDGAKIEGRLRDALDGLDSRLHVTPVILNRTIAVSGRPQAIAHLEAIGAVTDVRVQALIWGGVKGVAHPGVGPLYETSFGSNSQFGGVYLPADFKLPELPPDDLCNALRLIVATQSAEVMQQYMFKFGDALEPLIKQVRSMADDPRKTTGWSADARARVNLVLGIAATASGIELKSEDSLHTAVAYFQRTQADWTRERDSLEWAIAQLNLGVALSELSNLDDRIETRRAAMVAYQNALAVYQSRSDGLDSASIQLVIGDTFLAIAKHETGAANLRSAVDSYRAAAKEFDVNYYPTSWAEAQRRLGSALWYLGEQGGGAKDLEEAIVADREALKVYSKRHDPIMWAATQLQIAQSLERLGWATSNGDYFRKSVELSRQLLDGYPHGDDSVVWPEIQINLGHALIGMGTFNRGSEAEYAQQAVAAFRAALEKLSFEHQAIDWGTAKTDLGNALLVLGEKTGSDTHYQEQAIDALKDALKVYTPERDPIAWATAKYDLGDALVQLGERGPGINYLQQGVQNYREALAVLPKDGSPQLRNDIQHNLDIALEDLHQRGWTGS